MIRKANKGDVKGILAIYDEIHTLEEAGELSTGWIRGVYPTEETARRAISEDTFYVLEKDGEILASANINFKEADGYDKVSWRFQASGKEILVIHTLAVLPSAKGRGYGTEFVKFYEEMGKKLSCKALRLDTNEKNKAARALYKKLGYIESGIVKSDFNGLGIVNLVCLEKGI